MSNGVKTVMSSAMQILGGLSSSRSSPSTPTNGVGSNLCETCGIRPKFVENGYEHPYCGKTCATAAASSNGPNSYTPAPKNNFVPRSRHHGTGQGVSQTVPVNSNNNQYVQNQSTHPRAPRYGQNAAVYHQPSNCSNCGIPLQSNQLPCANCQQVSSSSPTTTWRKPGDKPPSLRELMKHDPKYGSVASAFLDAWNPIKTGFATQPTVCKVFEVLDRKSVGKFRAHQKSLGPKALEVTTFHSSQCVCDLGTKSYAPLCDIMSCGICSAVKSSFTEFAFGVKKNEGRYGEGVYSYTNSAVADQHATSCTSSPYKVTILCSVVYPSGVNASANSLSRFGAAVDPSRVAVANSDAIVPSFVIMYKVD